MCVNLKLRTKSYYNSLGSISFVVTERLQSHKLSTPLLPVCDIYLCSAHIDYFSQAIYATDLTLGLQWIPAGFMTCTVSVASRFNMHIYLDQLPIPVSDNRLSLSYPIHSRFSSEVPDVRSDQIRSTDPYRIRYDKLLHSYPVHITLNTAYFLHLVYPPFRFIGYAFFRLCSTDPFHL
jgi:hypothetical protein